MAETLNKVFIDVEVDASIAGDAELAKKLEEVCPVDIFKATDAGVEIVEEQPRRVRPLQPLRRRRARGHGARRQAVRAVATEAAAHRRQRFLAQVLGDDDQRAQLVEQLAVAVDLDALLARLAGDQGGDDADRRAGQAEVGLGGSAARGLDPAAGDAQLIGLAAAAQGQRRPQVGRRVQDHPDRVGQRGRRQVDHVLELLQAHPPAAQLDHRAFEAVAELGQLVDRRRAGRIELAALDDAVLLEVAQALGEDVGGGAADRAGQG